MRRLLSTEFTVGTFALLGLLIIIYMSLKVNDRGAVGAHSRTYVARFTSVTGLFPKVPVEVAGIAVGNVEEISLDGTRARIRIRVAGEIPVHDNASLTIRDRGILGDRYVQMNPGSPDRPPLKDGDEITKTFSQSDFERIAQSLAETSDTIRELVQSENPKGALGQVVVNLRDMSARLNDVVGNNGDRVSRILQNMESFSSTLDEITGENKEQVHTVLVALADVADAMKDTLGEGGSLSRAAQRFDSTMASVERIAQKIEKGEGTIGKLVNDDTTVTKMNETMDNLNETMGLYRKIQLNVRYRGEYLTGAERFQHQIGMSIWPAPDKFLMFEIVDAPAGRTRVVSTSVFQNGTVVSATKTVQTGDELLFTFLLGKRFWDLTLRFGLMRSTGGLGVDYSLFHDKFVVSFEAFDFARNEDRFHMRVFGTIVLYKHLILTGGVDDALTKLGSKNPFFGAGLQFNDEDFKSLVTLAPKAL